MDRAIGPRPLPEYQGLQLIHQLILEEHQTITQLQLLLRQRMLKESDLLKLKHLRVLSMLEWRLSEVIRVCQLGPQKLNATLCVAQAPPAWASLAPGKLLAGLEEKRRANWRGFSAPPHRN